MTKGTAKAITNIKPMAGGVAIAQLPVGGWVYGDVGATDMTGFTHYYRVNGDKVELSKDGIAVKCKATLGNLILSNEIEPGIPPVDPPPTESPFVSATLTRADGTTVEFIPKVS